MHYSQLSVCDVLYKKKDENEIGDHVEPDEEEDEEGEFIVGSQNEDNSDVPDFAISDIKEIIRKVRAIVTWFRKSPKQAEKLRRYTKEDILECNGLEVLKDCPTRWSTLYFCLKRFYRIRDKFQYIWASLF